MNKNILTLLYAMAALFLHVGCGKEKNAFEDDLPVVEVFVVEQLSDGGPFTHSVEYVVLYPEGLESYTSFPPTLWNDGGPPEGERFLLSRLHAKGKGKEVFRQDGRRHHTTATYDLSGLLSSEHQNFISLRAAGRYGKMKSVSIPIGYEE